MNDRGQLFNYNKGASPPSDFDSTETLTVASTLSVASHDKYRSTSSCSTRPRTSAGVPIDWRYRLRPKPDRVENNEKRVRRPSTCSHSATEDDTTLLNTRSIESREVRSAPMSLSTGRSENDLISAKKEGICHDTNDPFYSMERFVRTPIMDRVHDKFYNVEVKERVPSAGPVVWKTLPQPQPRRIDPEEKWTYFEPAVTVEPDLLAPAIKLKHPRPKDTIISTLPRQNSYLTASGTPIDIGPGSYLDASGTVGKTATCPALTFATRDRFPGTNGLQSTFRCSDLYYKPLEHRVEAVIGPWNDVAVSLGKGYTISKGVVDRTSIPHKFLYRTDVEFVPDILNKTSFVSGVVRNPRKYAADFKTLVDQRGPLPVHEGADVCYSPDPLVGSCTVKEEWRRTP